MISRILDVYTFVIFARVLMSWVPMFTRRPLDYRNPIVKVLLDVTEPVLAPVRRFTTVGMMDLSPIVVLVVLQAISRALSSA